MASPAVDLKRRVEIGRLLLKYGRADLVQVLDIDEAAIRDESTEDLSADPEELARDLEKMGPAFVKGGQLLSTRPDLLAEPYLESLARLQDNVEPIGFGEIERIVEEELGVRLSKAFSSFEAEPLGAASLAQVHAAEMRDGRPVVVKVQRPGVREQVLQDLEILDGMVGLAANHTDAGRRFGVDDLFGEFRRSMVRELDYRREARNLVTIAAHLEEDYPLLVVPRPVPDFSTSRVLTMERIDGQNVGKLSPLARLELDGEALAESLVKAYLDLILVHGVFNADPHPGNLLVTPDGRLGLIDMGMVAYLTPHIRDQVLRLLLAVSEGDSDEAAEITIAMGQQLADFDAEALKRSAADLLLPNRQASFSDVNLGRLVLEMVRVSANAGLRPAPELTMLGKTLLNLDEATRILAPEMRPAELIREHAASVMRKHLLRGLSPGQLFRSALEVNDFVQHLPGRMNVILDRLSQRDLELKIRVQDEERLVASMQKIANRITLGLIVAALIVGAALFARVPTELEILGYPALATLCFAGAAAVGAFVVAGILLNDRKDREPPS
jgi:predicted unusual protein kinase regulating ubiquinone biosynthesis (AarF/ABC1/UbiB family)